VIDRRTSDAPVPVERRKRGRRSLVPGQATTRLVLSLPSGMYDRVYALARQSRISIPEAIRRVLAHQLRNTKAESSSSSLTL
jgi:hypothetical protein